MAKGYNSRAYVSEAPGAFYNIFLSDFGATTPAAATLASQVTGSIKTTTADFFVEVAWVTAEGLGAAGTEVSIALNSATSYGVLVTQPSVPTNGQTVLGWRIYSAYATGGELLNTAPNTTTFTTTEGAVTGIPVATTTVTLLVDGSGSAPAAVDGSGVQPPLPSIPGNTTVNYYAIVPNTGSQWKQQKSVQFMKADGIAETLDVTLNHLDFIQPVYPGAANPPQGGANPPSATYTQASVASGTYMVMNGYLFQATQAGTHSTAATTFIGWAAFNTAKFGTTTDGSVTWTCLGKAGLIRFQFGNVNSAAKIPVAQEYSLFQD